jgi:hypothetical protein
MVLQYHTSVIQSCQVPANFQSFCQVSNLAAKFELGTGPARFYLGCQVFWSQYVFHEFLPRRLPSLILAANLAAKFKLGCQVQIWLPSSNLAAKFKLGSQVQTWQPSFGSQVAELKNLAKETNRACFKTCNLLQM